jgi:hypothetical protein
MLPLAAASRRGAARYYSAAAMPQPTGALRYAATPAAAAIAHSRERHAFAMPSAAAYDSHVLRHAFSTLMAPVIFGTPLFALLAADNAAHTPTTFIDHHITTVFPCLMMIRDARCQHAYAMFMRGGSAHAFSLSRAARIYEQQAARRTTSARRDTQR